MHTNKPIVVVTGATGRQGGSVINHLLQSGKYSLRGTTKDANSEAANNLKKKGVEVVKVDINKVDELVKAFQGAHAVFGVTNSYEKETLLNHFIEVRQGRNMVDAAKATGVQHFIWSALHDVDDISGGKIKVPHFTQKNWIQKYAIVQEVPSTFVYPGFYMSNFSEYFKPQVHNGVVTFSLPLKQETQLPLIDIADTGAWVLPVIENREKFLGKKVHMASQYVSMAELAQTYGKVFNRKAQFNSITSEVFASYGASEEFVHMMKWFDKFGYFNGEDISESVVLAGSNINTLEKWFKKSGPLV